MGHRDTIPTCNMCGKAVMVNGFHTEIFNGSYYTGVVEATIGNGSVLNAVLSVPTTGSFILDGVIIESSGLGEYDYYQGAVASGGTAVTVISNNLDLSNISPATVHKNPTIETTGTRLFGNRVDLKKGGGTTGTSNPWVLKKGTKYLARFTSSAATNYVRIEVRHTIY
jgi:hypothetical protein